MWIVFTGFPGQFRNPERTKVEVHSCDLSHSLLIANGGRCLHQIHACQVDGWETEIMGRIEFRLCPSLYLKGVSRESVG